MEEGLDGCTLETLKHIVDKFDIDLNKKSPFTIKCDRWRQLPRLFNELGFKIGAEIGVEGGLWSANLFRYIPDLKLYCIDKWEYFPGYRDFRNQKVLTNHYESAVTKLKPLNVEIIRKWSMDAVKDFKDNSLDFVFIDGNHSFEYVTNDIAEWSKKVRPNGIVSGHDFFRSRSGVYIHVKDVVQGWAYAHRIHPWFVLEGRSPCWMWIKE